ncbi:discoidin domain-containing protein [Sphingobacterium hungaricum]
MTKYKNIQLFFLASMLLTSMACKDHMLDEFSLGGNSVSTVKTSGISGPINKTNESVIVPVSIKLDKPASKAFEVSLSINQDSISKLIASGSLPDAVAVTGDAITIPNTAKVEYGSDSATFTISILRTALEKNYGKNVAVGYTIVTAGKGNAIDSKGNFQVISLNTDDILDNSDIHFLSLTNGAGTIIEAKNRTNYTSSSSGLSVPIGVSLASFPGNAFRVSVVTKPDTIANLVTSGYLPENTIALKTGEYTIASTVTFASNSSQSNLVLDVPWSIVEKYVGKKLAVFVELKNPTLHVLDEAKKYTTIVIDSEFVLEMDVTNQGVFSVNQDNNGGATHNEGSLKLVDNNYNSKFLKQSFDGTLWAQIVYTTPQNIGAYTITSANDAPERDPNAWNIQGSNDGVNWTVISNIANETFAQRFLTKRYEITNPTPYTHFRINFTSNIGSNLLQIGEWRMIRTP